MPSSVVALLVVAVLGALTAVYGGIQGSEGLLAAGLAVGFLSLILAPVLNQRANKRMRLFGRQDALLVWNYAPYETERIAASESRKTRKTSIRLSILSAVSLAVIFASFAVIAESDQARTLLLYIGTAAVLLPFISVWLAPAYTAAQIRKIPSTTIIGHDYILLNNRYIGINDRGGLTLVGAEVKQGSDGAGTLLLIYKFRMKYGSLMSFPVGVPIPQGQSVQAEQFAERLKTAQHS